MSPLRAWNTFWFAPISARPLGVFRIAYGLIVLGHLALLAPDVDYWLSDAGVLRGTEAREAAGYWPGTDPARSIPVRPSLLHWFQSPTAARLVLGGTAVAALLFSLGWRTRTMGVVQYLGLLSIHHRNLLSASGADVLLMLLAFYLMLSPCGAAYSLDALRAARRRGRDTAEPIIVPWAQRLIQLQITLVYLNTVLLKAAGPSWADGTALHYILSNVEIRRFHFGLTQYPLLINLMTHGAVLLELAIPILLWVRGARPWAIAAGLVLHGGIFLTINIPIFGEMMIASYLTFLAPEQFSALLRAFDARTWFSRARLVEPPRPIPGRVDGPGSLAGPHRPAPAVVRQPAGEP